MKSIYQQVNFTVSKDLERKLKFIAKFPQCEATELMIKRTAWKFKCYVHSKRFDSNGHTYDESWNNEHSVPIMKWNLCFKSCI